MQPVTFERGAFAMHVKVFAAPAALMLMVGALTTVSAQRNAADGARALEGGWVRLDTSGSGSFGGLTANFTRAVLTPEGAAKIRPQRDPDDVDPDNRPHKAGEPYIVTQGRCGGFGPGGVEPNSAALFIIPTRDEVLLTREGPGARHISTDGREHPPLSRIPSGGLGHSTATWENGDLVIDTIGLNEGGVTAGGWRTSETHLTERYHVEDDGMHMRIRGPW